MYQIETVCKKNKDKMSAVSLFTDLLQGAPAGDDFHDTAGGKACKSPAIKICNPKAGLSLQSASHLPESDTVYQAGHVSDVEGSRWVAGLSDDDDQPVHRVQQSHGSQRTKAAQQIWAHRPWPICRPIPVQVRIISTRNPFAGLPWPALAAL